MYKKRIKFYTGRKQALVSWFVKFKDNICFKGCPKILDKNHCGDCAYSYRIERVLKVNCLCYLVRLLPKVEINEFGEKLSPCYKRIQFIKKGNLIRVLDVTDNLYNYLLKDTTDLRNDKKWNDLFSNKPDTLISERESDNILNHWMLPYWDLFGIGELDIPLRYSHQSNFEILNPKFFIFKK